jgi:uncharacterized protein
MKGLVALVLILASSPLRADPFATAMQNVRDGQHAVAAASFHELARAGDATAAHNLAILFALGHGVPQNRTEAAYWAVTALLAGLDQAVPLADLMLSEISAADRDAVSARLDAKFAPLARQGDGAAMLAMAVILALVRPEPDLLAAYSWQSIAAALDVPGAAHARELTMSMMVPTQKAQAQAVAWQAFAQWCRAQDMPTPPSCTVIETSDLGAQIK